MFKINRKDLIWICFFVFASIPFVYFTNRYQKKFISNLTKINTEEGVQVDVNKAYNNRGLFILNNKYSMSSETVIISSTLNFKNPALVRFNNHKHIPTIDFIPPPYKLLKKENNDTIKVIKNKDTILLRLKK